MKHLKVLILSPSLNAEDNISGISSVTSNLLKYNVMVDYVHFTVGKKDNQKRNLRWLFYLLMLPIRFLKLVWCIHLDWIHFNIGLEPFSLLRDFPLYFIARQKGIPILLHVHGGRFVLNMSNNIVIKFIIRYLIHNSRQIITLSEIEKNALKKYAPSSQDKIVVIPNAVEVQEICGGAKDYESLLSILYLGRIDMNKGLREIVDALEILTKVDVDFLFYVCGTGPDKDWFLEQCRTAIGEHLRYEGVVLGTKKTNILQKSHIFLLPSYFEGLPIALLECMSVGIVPIVSSVGSIPQVVRSNNNGFIIHSKEDIVDSVIRLNSNRKLLKDLSINAIDTISSRFSINEYVKKINTLYYGNE